MRATHATCRLAACLLLGALGVVPARAQDDTLDAPAPRPERFLDNPDLESIDPQRIEALEEHADTSAGRSITLEDIEAVPDGSGADAYRRWLARRYSPSAPSTPALHVALRTRVQQEDEPRRGYLTGAYPGSRLAASTRIVVDYGAQWRAGAIIDRDAGETSLADRLGGYLRYEGAGFLRSFVIGDFTVNSGQGLVLWKSSGWSKGAETIGTVKRSDRMLTPFLSAGVNASMRGAAVQLGAGAWEATLFCAANALDASVDSATGAMRSLDASGQHRTAAELARLDASRERIGGAAVTARFETGGTLMKFGVAGYTASLTRPLGTGAGTAAPTTRRDMLGFSFDIHAMDANAFGEIARSGDGGLGCVAGVTARLSPRLHAALLYRGYAAGFAGMHGHAWGEQNGATANERGLYVGLDFLVSRRLILRAYVDQFHFPGPRYLVPVPTSGTDIMAMAEWRALPHVAVTLRGSRKRKQEAIAALDALGRAVKPVVEREQLRARLEFEYDDRRALMLRARIEATSVAFSDVLPTERGILLGVDVRRMFSRALTLRAGMATCQTASYESRITLVESDAAGQAGLAVLSGRGSRLFAMLVFRPWEGLSITAKYGCTILDGVREIGAGNDALSGDRVGKWTVQGDVRM